jgi:hypothetical protein
LIAPIFGEALYPFGAAGTDCFEHRLVGDVEEARGLQEGVGVSAPHEPVSNQADI